MSERGVSVYRNMVMYSGSTSTRSPAWPRLPGDSLAGTPQCKKVPGENCIDARKSRDFLARPSGSRSAAGEIRLVAAGEIQHRTGQFHLARQLRILSQQHLGALPRIHNQFRDPPRQSSSRRSYRGSPPDAAPPGSPAPPAKPGTTSSACRRAPHGRAADATATVRTDPHRRPRCSWPAARPRPPRSRSSPPESASPRSRIQPSPAAWSRHRRDRSMW